MRNNLHMRTTYKGQVLFFNREILLQESKKITNDSLYNYYLPKINIVFAEMYETFLQNNKSANILENEKIDKFSFLKNLFKRKTPKQQKNNIINKLPENFEPSLLLYLLLQYEIKNMEDPNNKLLLQNFIYSLRQESNSRKEDKISFENNFVKPEQKEIIEQNDYTVLLANIFLNLMNEYVYSEEEILDIFNRYFENFNVNKIIYILNPQKILYDLNDVLSLIKIEITSEEGQISFQKEDFIYQLKPIEQQT